MSMSVTIKDDNNQFNKIIKDLKVLSKLEGKVGIFHDSGSTFKGQRILDYAAIQEFGNKEQGGSVPARSFIRSTADENNYWQDDLKLAVIDVIDGKSPGVEFTKVAIKAKDTIKKKILKGDEAWEPLKESTIRKKKSSRPLIDKGFLVNSIKYKIALKD